MFAGAELEWVLADALDHDLLETWRLTNQISQSRGS